MEEKSARPQRALRPDRAELVCAIGHEVGNHLAGIRLQAHLIDSDQEMRELAASSVGIDRLAGRSGPLLALLRPIVAGPRKPTEAVDWATLFHALSRDLEDEGTGGVRVEFDGQNAPAAPADAVEGIHSLLMALIFATIDGLESNDTVRVRVDRGSSGSIVQIEDAGPVENVAVGSSLRGRPLMIAIARCLLEDVGGTVETHAKPAGMRIELAFVDA